MKLKTGLAAVAVAALAVGTATGAAAEEPQWWVRGSFYAGSGATWDVLPEAQLIDDGMHGDGADGDGLYGVAITSDQGTGRFEMKADTGTWAVFAPPDNQLLHIFTADEVVNVTFDTRVHRDGWFPITNILWSDHSFPAGFVPEVTGNAPQWSNWTIGSPATFSGGMWAVTVVFPTAGTYEYKWRANGNWDDFIFATGGGSAGLGGNLSFTTTDDGAAVLFEFDPAVGRARATGAQVTDNDPATWSRVKALYYDER